LHGRSALKLHLEAFGYRQAAEFAPTWPQEDRVRLYGVFGGLARHLAHVDPARDLTSNMRGAILDPLSPLHDAAHDILRSERLSSLADADAVMSAVACGENRFNAISARTGLPAPRLDYVLKELQSLGVVRREVRMGDSHCPEDRAAGT